MRPRLHWGHSLLVAEHWSNLFTPQDALRLPSHSVATPPPDDQCQLFPRDTLLAIITAIHFI